LGMWDIHAPTWGGVLKYYDSFLFLMILSLSTGFLFCRILSFLSINVYGRID
jgi:hypothetical protein